MTFVEAFASIIYSCSIRCIWANPCNKFISPEADTTIISQRNGYSAERSGKGLNEVLLINIH